MVKYFRKATVLKFLVIFFRIFVQLLIKSILFFVSICVPTTFSLNIPTPRCSLGNVNISQGRPRVTQKWRPSCARIRERALREVLLPWYRYVNSKVISYLARPPSRSGLWNWLTDDSHLRESDEF